MLMILLLALQLSAQNVPDYRDDLDRVNNFTWDKRPKWSEVTPNTVTVYYADIPGDLKAKVKNIEVTSDFYLPDFATPENRFFWIENYKIFYKSEDVARQYKARIKALKKFLKRFDIPIQSELRGVPLTSHSTLKVYNPEERKDYVFLKLYGSKGSIFTTNTLNALSEAGLELPYYPEVKLKELEVSNFKRGRRAKKISMPSQVFRSPETSLKKDISDHYAISLHSVLSNKTLLDKLAKKANYTKTLNWYKKVLIQRLAMFFYRSYPIIGVLPGAHAQNIVAIITKDFELKELVWRDLTDFSHNPIITYSNLGFSVLSDNFMQINKPSGEVDHRFWLPVVGPFLKKIIATSTFGDFFGGYMGQVFNVELEKNNKPFVRHELVLEFFKSLIELKYDDPTVERVLNKMRIKMSNYPNVLSFANFAGAIYNDFYTQEITKNFPINKYTTNYTKQSLIKAFVESLKNNNVGFYDQFPKKWLRWINKLKFDRVAEALQNTPNYQLLSNGVDILMLRDTRTGKWMALSYRQHSPVAFDYLKHQKLLKINVNYRYFRGHVFHCKALFY